MKILVTGAYGQLGREISELSAGYPSVEFIFTDVDTLDITNQTAIDEMLVRHQPDFLVNCAAYTAVDKAEDEREAAQLINAVAPGLIASSSKKAGTKFIHVSTDYVFDGSKNRPYNESDPVNPLGFYGFTKQEGEAHCQANNPDSVIVRTSWLYSSFGNNFVKTMLRLGGERDSLNVVFDQVGSPTYAADLAEAILKIIHTEEWIPGVYHFSDEGVCSWYDFSLAIFELSGIKCRVAPIRSDEYPTKTRRPHYSVFDKSKIKSIYNLKIPYWRDSLKICLEKISKD
jgi:dTDP-4-dehydrorhamnose reductase